MTATAEPEALIHVDGQWEFPRNGSGGFSGQFLDYDAATAFVLERKFDSAQLVDYGMGGRKGWLGDKDGVRGWLFDDGGFLPVASP